MPAADWFAAAMSRLGISEGTRVVLYDARESMWAARVWWMLRAFGFDNAAVLNGGWTAWQLERRPISSEPCSYLPATFTAAPRLGLFAGKEEVLRAIDDPKVCIVCALGRRQYRGDRREYGRRRGTSPGRATSARGGSSIALRSVIARWTSCASYSPRFLTLSGSSLIVAGGVAGASDAFVLHLLGHRNVAVYDGGFMEWSGDKRLPLELGDARPRSRSSAMQ